MIITLYIVFLYSIKYICDGMTCIPYWAKGSWCCVGINIGIKCHAAQPVTQATDDIQGYLNLTLWQNTERPSFLDFGYDVQPKLGNMNMQLNKLLQFCRDTHE